MPDWGTASVHGHTFMHSWSGSMTLVPSQPAAWSYFPVQSYSCSPCIFYRILVVSKDTLNPTYNNNYI